MKATRNRYEMSTAAHEGHLGTSHLVWWQNWFLDQLRSVIEPIQCLRKFRIPQRHRLCKILLSYRFGNIARLRCNMSSPRTRS
jgi:hypothetical protein